MQALWYKLQHKGHFTVANTSTIIIIIISQKAPFMSLLKIQCFTHSGKVYQIVSFSLSQ